MDIRRNTHSNSNEESDSSEQCECGGAAEEALVSLARCNFSKEEAQHILRSLDIQETVSLLSLARQVRIVPLLLNFVGDFTGVDANSCMSVEFHRHHKAVEAHKKSLKELALLCKEEQVRFVLLKGFSISMLAYDDVGTRQVGDIDLLIDEEDVPHFDWILRRLGYFQPSVADGPHASKRALTQLLQYRSARVTSYPVKRHAFGDQLAPYYAADFPVRVEVHTGVCGLPSSFVNRLLWENELIDVDGCHIRVPRPSLAFLVLLLTAYSNATSYYSLLDGEQNLRDFVDIRNIVNRNIERMDVRWLRNLIRELGVEGKVATVAQLYREVFGENSWLLDDLAAAAPAEPGRQLLAELFGPALRFDTARRMVRERCSALCLSEERQEEVRITAGAWNDLPNRFNLSIRYAVSIEQGDIVVRWRISSILPQDLSSLGLRLSFVPLSEAKSLEHKMVLVFSDNEPKGYYGSGDRIAPKLFTKDRGRLLECESNVKEGEVCVDMRLPPTQCNEEENFLEQDFGLIPAVYLRESKRGYRCIGALSENFSDVVKVVTFRS